ncbi:hypothetical protein W97_06671 [Coniosporium apollinis CBS 100218]|uniref:DAGKc domain-containing protein n=1 Tax=Coniosporium apollinis (strain CBS 100218) TaxID=1168221 RepID=R7Z005_CONA1|nr:uncharacterized protein W97_06671 [Coniosporium apollinis CBS 100218]EON67418.1 hypothetical protein W97_06671 [Coniosporium apollinis CBS 100218]
MTAESTSDGNPFDDPLPTQPQPEVAPEATLAVGRNASLTLATDSLIILDEGFVGRETSNCCGLLPSRSKTTLAVPFFNILWAELSDWEIAIRYARQVSKDVVRPAYVNYTIDKNDRVHAQAWIEQLLNRAYGASQRQKRIKVLINPFGGKGSAAKWYTQDIEPIFAAARCEVNVERTQYMGHARDLVAESLDPDAWDVIACCSGDGVPHEVFNGLARKKDAARALAQVAVVQLPCGTGNALSLNLYGSNSPSIAALGVVKGLRTPLDLVSITQGDTRSLSFLSQSVGIIAESDLGTENLRWMGSARFTYGFLIRLLGKTVYPCEIAVQLEDDQKSSIREAFRAEASKPLPSTLQRDLPPPDAGLPALRFGTVNDPLPQHWQLVPHDKIGNFYTGNMAYMSPDTPFFPGALPNDGCLDMVCIDGDIPRSTALKMLLSVEKGTFFEMPEVTYRKVSAYRIIPKQCVKRKEDGYISIDGERVPFEPFQAEVHRGLGTVLSRTGHMYEAHGLR